MISCFTPLSYRNKNFLVPVTNKQTKTQNLDFHIAVDVFYLIHLRRALVFAQRELTTGFFPVNQTIVKGLSGILEKKKN